MFLKKGFYILILSLLMLVIPRITSSLTLDEAISLAKQNLPSYQAARLKVRSLEEIYKASLSPYLPSVDAQAAHTRIYTSNDEFNTNTYNLSISYLLYDAGKRRANREIAWLDLDISNEELRKNLFDLEFSVKNAYFNVIAKKEILEQRKIQLQDAKKDFEIAEGRYKFGVARLSDVLHASVRLEQARFNLTEAEGDLKKAIYELNSIIGLPLDSHHDIKETLDLVFELPDRDKIAEIIFKRPEIKQAENLKKISENNRLLAKSTFFPNLSITASYSKTETRDKRILGNINNDENSLKIIATWNIFELGKFFRYKASEYERDVSDQGIEEIKRTILLDMNKTYEDLLTSINKVKVAEEQLKQAEHNYSQALGEYRVGKGDILSLVQAESFLSIAREQLVASKLNVMLTKARLERVAGIHRLEYLNN